LTVNFSNAKSSKRNATGEKAETKFDIEKARHVIPPTTVYALSDFSRSSTSARILKTHSFASIMSGRAQLFHSPSDHPFSFFHVLMSASKGHRAPAAVSSSRYTTSYGVSHVMAVSVGKTIGRFFRPERLRL
jgi:hypothetical protein